MYKDVLAPDVKKRFNFYRDENITQKMIYVESIKYIKVYYNMRTRKNTTRRSADCDHRQSSPTSLHTVVIASDLINFERIKFKIKLLFVLKN
jgi:hypothetical protein